MFLHKKWPQIETLDSGSKQKQFPKQNNLHYIQVFFSFIYSKDKAYCNKDMLKRFH